MGSTQVPLGEYIFRRLYSLGIRHIFGVPGDFNLNLLDHIDSVDGLSWIGTRNELNGAYAADGYARCRGLPGVIVTTYGVGELSAINGIGGAFTEYVPLIHIVGMTPRYAQEACLMIHHCPGEGLSHKLYTTVSKPLSAATAILDDDASFTQKVDYVIESCFKTKLPVYLYIPIDTPDIMVDASRLQIPLDISIANPGKEGLEDEIVQKIIASLHAAQKPAFLIDLLTRRFGLAPDVQEILRLTGLPGFVTPLGKSIVDETSENFGGLYVGAITPDTNVKDALESSDLVIYFGRFPTDSNTAGWSQKLATSGTLIVLHPKYVSIGDKTWEAVSFVPIVNKLLERLRKESIAKKDTYIKPNKISAPQFSEQLHGPLRQKSFWDCFAPFLRDGDCVIAEVGTSQYATFELQLPGNADYHTQLFYSCIGFSVGLALGALVARKEMGLTGRVVLFVGDGSLQLTVQEISTMIHLGFKPLIFIISNSGYTVERVIHGPSRKYNDIDPWNFQYLLPFFGGTPENSNFHSVGTYEQLLPLLKDKDFASTNRIQVVECLLDRYDSPQLMTTLVDLGAAGKAKVLEKLDKEAGRTRVKLDGTLTESGLSTE